MEKYAVKTDNTKTASVTEGCPTCGKSLEKMVNVPKCGACGTKPFEVSE